MRATFIFLIILQTSWVSSAQDILTKKNGDEIKAKVLTITPQEIKYKLFTDSGDSLDAGEELYIAKSEVFMIKYQNGTKEVFSDNDPSSPSNKDDIKLVSTVPVEQAVSEKTKVNMFYKGEADAMSYYKGYKGAARGTLVASLLSPLGGLIPAIVCSAANPKDQNLTYPSQEQFQNPDYRNGYRFRAKSIKSGRVWRNWGIGLVANLIVLIAVAQ